MKTIRKRRRIECKTDYKARLLMLQSGNARVVFRKTNRYIIGQLVKSKEASDSVLIGLDSRELKKYGWPESGSIKSLPAAYLTGLLLGKKIIDKEGKIKVIFDIGLQRNAAKSKEYAFLKGIVDSGVSINCNEKMFPEESRINGEHLKKRIDFGKIKTKIGKE